MIAFGPVPSRRLGRSIGMNNIPPKTCSYSCVYCQLGRTLTLSAEPTEFYEPLKVVEAGTAKVKSVTSRGEAVDYLTFVPDGEPTLDSKLGTELRLLKEQTNVSTAVITNSSLIWRDDVRHGLLAADWVSFKVDAAREDAWRSINRPHPSLALDSILEGIVSFASRYTGILATETMLVEGVNTDAEQLARTARFLGQVQPSIAYLAIPTRPPAEKWVAAPAENTINQAYQLFSNTIDRVEYLIGYEGTAFSSTGDLEEDLLSITAVHPMRKDAVAELINKTEGDWSTVDELVDRGELIRSVYNDNEFYLRKLS